LATALLSEGGTRSVRCLFRQLPQWL
jgi:hypothetical protein